MKARILLAVVLAGLGNSAIAQTPVNDKTKVEIVCSYAPSQSKAVASIASAAGGSAAALTAVAQVTGLAVVAHSSGAAILTGSGGYIAGTIGAAAAGPFIVTVGIAAGAAAMSVELLCAPKNHPKLVKKVQAAAVEFARRSKEKTGETKAATAVNLTAATAAVKRVAGDAVDYAYGRTPRSKTTPLTE